MDPTQRYKRTADDLGIQAQAMVKRICAPHPESIDELANNILTRQHLVHIAQIARERITLIDQDAVDFFLSRGIQKPAQLIEHYREKPEELVSFFGLNHPLNNPKEMFQWFLDHVDELSEESIQRIIEISESYSKDVLNPYIYFFVEDQKIEVNKFLLVARSPYFRALLTGPMVEARETEIALNEVSVETFNHVKLYLQTNNLSKLFTAKDHIFLQVLSFFDMCNLAQDHVDEIFAQITVRRPELSFKSRSLVPTESSNPVFYLNPFVQNNVVSLNLKTYVDDRMIQALIERWIPFRKVILSLPTKLSEDSWNKLSDVDSLTLNLQRCRTYKDVPHLKCRVKLLDCHFNMLLLAERLPRLMNFSSTSIKGEQLKKIVECCPDLEELSLRNMTDSTIETIGGLKQLRQLNLSYCPLLTNEGLKYLKELSFLQKLILPLNDKAKGKPEEDFDDLTSLVHLDVTNRNIRKIPNLFLLKTLCLGGTDIASFESLPVNQPKLVFLDVSNTRISSHALPHLARLSKLQILHLSETKIDTFPCDENSFSSLNVLNVAGTNINDEALQGICQLERLEILNISRCPNITTDGLFHLLNSKNLKEVHISECEGIDEGALDSFEQRYAYNIDLIRY